ncbi:MAG: cysteine--tRNA ligase [bacterium]
MSFTIYDTFQRRQIPFEPMTPGVVKMYNCGPTVYNLAHIGNYRAFLFADLLRRWLEVSGYAVEQVMNITDVDDKTIQKSREEGLTLKQVTDRYIKVFFDELKQLNILPAKVYPRATDHIAEMVDLIRSLLEKGHAYKGPDGSIYFRVESYPEYGSLSGKRLEDLRIGDRVSSDEYESKEDVRDFALWKAWDREDGEVVWDTEVGKGRPGWHIECSAMSRKHLGEEFDIHTGGVDNIFPHHENEIAQSRCATGSRFAHHWMHCNYLIIEGKKMSKSLGNYYTFRDLIDQEWRAREIRYVLVATHYRAQLNFTLEGLGAARAALARLDEFRDSWRPAREDDVSAEIREIHEQANRGFDAAMDDDLNVSAALASVFQLVREVNAQNTLNGLTSGDVKLLEKTWDRWDHALGVFKPEVDKDEDSEWIERKIEERRIARERKDWGAADRIRDELLSQGIQLKDGADGTTWRRT